MTLFVRGMVFCAIFIFLFIACEQVTLEGDISPKGSNDQDSQAVDPVRVSPETFRMLSENEYVRVIENHAKPGQKDFMHSHPESAWYVLEGESRRISTPDGLIRTETLKPGSVTFQEPVRMHATENVGSADLKIIMVERKAPLAPGTAGSDPVSAPPGIYRILGEDGTFRVIEIKLKPGEKDNPRGRPARIAYAVTDVSALLHTEGEDSRPLTLAAGDVLYQPPVPIQQLENTGTSDIRMISFEILR